MLISELTNVATTSTDSGKLPTSVLINIVMAHDCAKHPLFDYLSTNKITVEQVARYLRNYDAHATLLRRLLLKSAALMPEKAVGFILENVRNEYGNGDADKRHQLQLIDLAYSAGVTPSQFWKAPIQADIRAFMKAATILYCPTNIDVFPIGHKKEYFRPAITAGAIATEEILAVTEFKAMQRAFAHFNLANHIWFDHVAVEADHTDDSLALSSYFIYEHNAHEAVIFGVKAMLDANMLLYNGLLAALNGA
jgi:hypothetical protein